MQAAEGMKGKRLHTVYDTAKENGTISRNSSDAGLTNRSWGLVSFQDESKSLDLGSSTVANSGEESLKEWVWEDKNEFSISTTCSWNKQACEDV